MGPGGFGSSDVSALVDCLSGSLGLLLAFAVDFGAPADLDCPCVCWIKIRTWTQRINNSQRRTSLVAGFLLLLTVAAVC